MRFNLREFLKRILASAASGLLAGISAAAILWLLDLATRVRESQGWLLYGLPLVGFLTHWLYREYGRDLVSGHNLILDEIHDPKQTIPARMTPLIIFTSTLTHLVGGSAGREGITVQSGAALSDQVAKFFRATIEERRFLLVAGAGAGFGSAIGAPWAGMIFGMEVIQIGRISAFAWMECFVASFVGYGACLALGVSHLKFAPLGLAGISHALLGYAALGGIVFGWSARFFVWCTHSIEKILAALFRFPPWRGFLGGLLLCFLLLGWEGNLRFAGLGIPQVLAAFHDAAGFWDPLWKLGFSSLTIASGFKGGEFMPLLFIGSKMGSALSTILPVACDAMAALGLVAVFAGAANTPLACTILAGELFGWNIFPYAAIACFVSYFVSGNKGIYRSQKSDGHKLEKFSYFLFRRRAVSKPGS